MHALPAGILRTKGLIVVSNGMQKRTLSREEEGSLGWADRQIRYTVQAKR